MKTQLGQEHLDASQLAGLTNSNPIYFITNTPEHGKIMRIVRSSNPGEKPTRDREVWQFTHEEVKNGVIYFVRQDLRNINTSGGQVNDSFSYRLEAPGVQPAFGLFDFVIGPSANEGNVFYYTFFLIWVKLATYFIKGPVIVYLHLAGVFPNLLF